MFSSRSAIVIAVIAATVSTAFAHERDDEERHEHTAKLYDARGKLVGTVVDAPVGDVSDGGVIMDVKGAAVFGGFARTETPEGSQSASELQWSGVTATYSGRDCTGTPYIPYTLGPLRPAVIERKGGKVVLYVAKEQPSQYESVSSVDYSGDCSNYVDASGMVGWIIGDSVTLSDEYPEPLHIGY